MMNTVLDTVAGLYTNKLIEDDRIPTIISENFYGYRIGFVPLKVAFQVQIISFIVGQIAVSNVLGVITWYGVIVPMKRQNRLVAFLVGLGIVIPTSLLLPVWFINFVDLRSKVLRFGCILVPMLVPFKCLDALFGVESPERNIRMKSLQHYIYYMGFLYKPKFAAKQDDDDNVDGKTSKGEGKPRRVVVPMTRKAAMRAHNGFLGWFLITSAFIPLLLALDGRPFPDETIHPEGREQRDPAFDIYPAFKVTRIYNTFFQSIALFLTLIFSMYGVALICCLLGNMQIEDSIFDKQPLFCATSASDFWGRKWNALVHHNLKEGIYLPVRAWMGWKSPYSKPLSVLATFAASGLLHEYVWALMFFHTDQELTEGDACRTCYNYAFGKHIVFFGWNGMLIVLENSGLGKIVGSIFRGLRLPAPIHSHLVVLTALPVGHLFTEDMIDGGYFSHLKLGLPLLTFERL